MKNSFTKITDKDNTMGALPFEKFVDGFIAFKKLAFSLRVHKFRKAGESSSYSDKSENGELEANVGGSQITKPEHAQNATFATAHLEDKIDTKPQGFMPYGKAQKSGNALKVEDYLDVSKRPKQSLKDSPHLMAILKSPQYFFSIKTADKVRVNPNTSGFDEKDRKAIDTMEHGLNNSQLHALFYLNSHGLLKDAPPVISDKYQQDRYFEKMQEQIKLKQDWAKANGKDWVLDTASLKSIHSRARKSLLPKQDKDGDTDKDGNLLYEYRSDVKARVEKEKQDKAAEKRAKALASGKPIKAEPYKTPTAAEQEINPNILRGSLGDLGKYVGLAKNTSSGGELDHVKPDKDGNYTNEQLQDIDNIMTMGGGYSPATNANFTRMWHAVMHDEVWGMINGSHLDMGKPGTKEHKSNTEKRALYHKEGPKGIIEKLAAEASAKADGDPVKLHAIGIDRTKALVALGILFTTDHIGQALASEGEANTFGGDGAGHIITPSGEWIPYDSPAEKKRLSKQYAQDSGALWYDDDMAQTDFNIIHVLKHMQKSAGMTDIEDLVAPNNTVPPTDRGTIQHDHITAFKALMAPTSFGMKPGANLKVAFKIYQQAITAKKNDKNGENRSVFSYIDEKQIPKSEAKELHLQHENRLYDRTKAISNSMAGLDPELYKNIKQLYDSDKPEEIKKAIYLQKEFVRLKEYRDILIKKGENAKLLPPIKEKEDEGEQSEEDKENELKSMQPINIRENNEKTNTIELIRAAALDPNFVVPSDKEDDIDITVKGALKQPNTSALTRLSKKDMEEGFKSVNGWTEDVHKDLSTGNLTTNRANLIKNLKKLEFTSADLTKDWTTRGGSINPMIRFIKNYSGAFGKDGDKQLASFLNGSHDARFMAHEWAKYSLHRNSEGKNEFQVEYAEAKTDAKKEAIAKEYADFISKSETKFKNAAPKGLRPDIDEGKIGVSGSYIFGPKGGNFHQDLSYNGGYPTKDLWYTRWMLWGLGSQTNARGHLIDTPASTLAECFDLVNDFAAQEFGMSNKQIQAVGWYHWKNYQTRMGVRTAGMENYTGASKEVLEKMGVKDAKGKTPIMPEINRQGADDEAVNASKGRRTRANISPANQSRANAKSRVQRRDAEQPKGKVAKRPNTTSGKKKYGREVGGRGRPIKFAQFTQAPGGMTGTPVATRTNQPFSNAVAKSPGGKNLAQGALGNQINAKGGVNTTAQNAVGDWPNGSEESIIHTAPQGTDPRRLKYLGAWHGISGQKKSVLVFHPNPKGPDSLYHMVHPSTDMGEVREQLIAAGINYKTLLPGKTSTRVVVYDPNRVMRNTIDQFATNNNLNVEENIGQGEIVGHNGDWNSAGALPKSRQAYTNIIGEYEQNSNQAGPANNTSGAPTNGTSTSTGQAQQLSRKTKTKIKFDRSRRVLEGFLRQHNTPNKELPPVGDLLSQDFENIKPEHLSKYQQLIPDAKWSDIEGAVSSLQKDPSLYDDMTSESNRREMYCKEHARTVLQSSGLKKLIDSLRVQNLIPEHAQHLIEDAKDGDYFSLEAISSELQHSVPSLRAFSKAAEKEYNKAGKVWDKMRTVQPQKFAKKSAHAKDQYRAGAHGITFRGRNYNGGQFAPQNDGVKRFEKDSNLTHMIKKLRGV